MKKFLFSILTVLYLLSINGTTLYTHLCMGRLADWSFTTLHNDSCNKCGMEMEEGAASGCCNDQEELVKLDDDQQTVSIQKLNDIHLNVIAPLPYQANMVAPVYSLNRPVYYRGHAPPRRCGAPLFIFNQSFLI